MTRLVGRLRDLLGQDMDIEVRHVDDLARERSGKLRYFVSDIPEAQVSDGRHP